MTPPSQPEVLKCLLSIPQCMLKDGVRIYNTSRHLRSIKNDLAIETTPDPIFLWVLILKAITHSPCKNIVVWPRDTSVLKTEYADDGEKQLAI